MVDIVVRLLLIWPSVTPVRGNVTNLIPLGIPAT